MVKALKPPLYFPMDFVAKKLKMNYGVLSRVLSVVPLVRVKEVRPRENTEALLSSYTTYQMKSLSMILIQTGSGHKQKTKTEQRP